MNRFAVLRLAPAPAIAAAFVLQTFAVTATPLEYLWRPLVVAVIAAVVVEVPLVLALGTVKGALAAAFVVSAALSLWPVAAAIGVAAVWWVGIQGMRSIGGRPPAPSSTLGQIANGAGIFAAILLVLTTATATTAALALPGRTAPPDPAPIDADAPDIYLLMLDGYPRADTLRTEFDYDAAPFLSSLSARGFSVASASRSNYTKTWLTLASMFHMRHWADIDPLTPVPTNAADQYRALFRAVNQAPLVTMLAQQGYRTTSIASPMVSTALVHAHEFLPGDQLNSFEMNLLEGSTLASLVEALAPDYLLDQQRDRLHWTLRSVVEVAERNGTGGPQFVYAHVMSPHPPFLFNANGDHVRNPDCYPARCRMWWPERYALGMTPAEFAEGMREQVAYLNELLISVLDRVIQAQPDTVIILVSDHGARHDPAKQDEYFLNFFAARTPGRESVFADDISPITVFPALFSAYFGVEVPPLAYEAWLSDSALPLILRRVR